LRKVYFIIASMFCGGAIAQDAGISPQILEPNGLTPQALVASSVPEPAPANMYAESKVVELITRIACEELRYPQRDLAASERRYKELAQSLGFELSDPAKLQRTLRYYQSNAEFMRAHQQAISANSMRCVTATDQVSTRQ